MAQPLILPTLLFSVGLLLSGQIRAEGPLPYLRNALSFNAELVQARETMVAANEGIALASAVLLPQAQGFVSIPPNPRNSSPYRLRLTQTLFNISQFKARDRAKILQVSAEQRLNEVRQRLLLQIYQVFLEAMEAEGSLAIIAWRKATLQQQEVVAENSYELGQSTLVDLLRVRSDVGALAATEATARRQHESAKRNLERLTGLRPTKLPELRGTPLAPTGSIEEWVLKAGNSASVLVAESNLRSQQINSAMLLSRLLPSAELVTHADRDGSRVAAEIMIPLFSSGGSLAKLRQSQALERSFGAAYDRALRLARQEAAQAYLVVIEQFERIHALEASSGTRRQQLQAAEDLVELGASGINEVLRATEDLATVEIALLAARHSLLLSVLKLESAAGILTLESAATHEHLFHS